MIKIDNQAHTGALEQPYSDVLEQVLSTINAYEINGLKSFIAERLLVEELKESNSDLILSVNRAYETEIDLENTDNIPYVVLFAGYPTLEYPDGYNPTKGFLTALHQYNLEDMKHNPENNENSPPS